jgi:hypothetical protein
MGCRYVQQLNEHQLSAINKSMAFVGGKTANLDRNLYPGQSGQKAAFMNHWLSEQSRAEN